MFMTPEVQARAQAAIDYFTAHPDKHDQRSWIDGPDAFVDSHDDEGTGVHSPEIVNLCDTTMCVAGLVQFQDQGFVRVGTAAFEGADLLGLAPDEARFLFYDSTDEAALAGLAAIATGDSWAFGDVMDAFYNPPSEYDDFHNPTPDYDDDVYY